MSAGSEPRVPRRRRARRRVAVSRAGVAGTVVGLIAVFAPTVSASAAGATLSPQQAPVKVPIGHAIAAPVQAKDLGPEDTTTTLHLDVSLAPRDPAALQSFLSEVYDPSSPSYHHFLAQGEFGPTFGASAATIAAVDSQLVALGLQPGPVNPDDVIIPVTTTVGQAEKALGVTLHSYRLASGRVAYANTTAPLLPSAIAPSVVAITGLSTIYQLKPQDLASSAPSAAETRASGSAGAAAKVLPRIAGPVGCPSAQAAGGYTGDQLATAYGFTAGAYSKGMLGSGETIALYELEPYAPSDVSTFDSCYGVNPTVNEVNVDGGAGTGPGSGESILDIENVIELAPQATLDVYEAPNGGSGPTDEYTQIADDDTAEVVSTSWGICEPQEGEAGAQAEEIVFAQMASQGQSILDAAGDAGAEDCYGGAGTSTALAVDDPGSDPYVTAVGGTTLTLNTNHTLQSETVWNNGGTPGNVSGGAGGGGVSTFWSIPSWQTGTGVFETGLSQSGTYCGAATGTYCREVPDVAAVANPDSAYSIYDSVSGTGQWTAEGGTSGAAPVWAALTALADESCGATKPAQAAGLLNPALYRNPSDMNDITSGNNDYTGTNNGDYPAGTGYDMASGLGSPTAALFAPGVLCVNKNSIVTAATVSASNRQQAATSNWTYTFTTGGTGSLAANTATVTLGAPAGTSFPAQASNFSVNGNTVTGTVTVGGTTNAPTVTLTTPVAVGDGTAVTVVVDGVINPTAGVDPASDFTVATSSDTATQTVSAGLDFGSGATGLAVTSSSAAAGGSSTWTYDFSTSSSGALGSGDTVTLVAPTGTTFPTAAADYTVGGITVGAVSVTGPANSVTLTVPASIAASSPVDVTIGDVTNPPVGTYSNTVFSASTIADSATNASAGLTFSSGVTNVSYSATVSQAGQQEQWLVGFTTSSTGSLTSGNTVTLTAPVGTVWPAAAGNYLVGGSTPSTVSVANPANSVTVTVPTGFTAVGARVVVSLTVSDVTNPPPGNDPASAFEVATSVDTIAGQAATGISFGSGVTRVSLSATSSVPAASDVDWTYDFQTSDTGALSQGDSLTLEAPTPATFPTQSSDYTIDGVKAGAGDVSVTPGTPNTATITLSSSVGASTQVKVVVSAMTNPAQGSYPATDFEVSTTADAAGGPVSQVSFPSALSGVAVASSSTSAGAVATWTYSYTSGALGGLAAGQPIELVAPSGTTLPSATSDYRVDGTGVHVVTATAANSVEVDTPIAIAGGSSVSVVVSGVTDPPAGTYPPGDFAVSTATDTGIGHPAMGLTFVNPPPSGYRLVGADGGVFSFGGAQFYGSVPGLGVHVNDVVAAVSTPSGNGYWLFGADGGVFSFGGAQFYGSVPGLGVHVSDVVAAVSTPSGNGYWLVGADGGVFSFGGAPFDGSVPGLGIHIHDVVAALGASSAGAG